MEKIQDQGLVTAHHQPAMTGFLAVPMTQVIQYVFRDAKTWFFGFHGSEDSSHVVVSGPAPVAGRKVLFCFPDSALRGPRGRHGQREPARQQLLLCLVGTIRGQFCSMAGQECGA